MPQNAGTKRPLLRSSMIVNSTILAIPKFPPAQVLPEPNRKPVAYRRPFREEQMFDGIRMLVLSTAHEYNILESSIMLVSNQKNVMGNRQYSQADTDAPSLRSPHQRA